MKSDKSGSCQCLNGQESYEKYYSSILKESLIRYDYRNLNGKLFLTVGKTLEICRKRRDMWDNGN